VLRAALAGVAVIALAEMTQVPAAAAAPPGFPDLGRFSAVDPAPYISVGIKAGRGIGFAAGQLRCGWSLSTDPNAHTGVACSGDIPGIPDEVPQEPYAPSCDGISMSGPSGGTSVLYTFLRGKGPCPPPEGLRPLPAGAKITADNTTCAVTTDVVACIDPIVNHGFVLQHPRSWVF
jgi:hypothetical protein